VPSIPFVFLNPPNVTLLPTHLQTALPALLPDPPPLPAASAAATFRQQNEESQRRFCMSKSTFSYFSLCTLVLHAVVVFLLLSVGVVPVAHAQNHPGQDTMATNKPVPMIGKPAPDFKGAVMRERKSG
jgi:hypothetical protein